MFYNFILNSILFQCEKFNTYSESYMGKMLFLCFIWLKYINISSIIYLYIVLYKPALQGTNGM